MRRKTSHKWFIAAALGVAVAGGAPAQTVVLKGRNGGGSVASVSVTMRGQSAYATVSASRSDARSLFRDMAAKSGVKILVAPNAGGFVTTTVASQPLEEAIKSVAASAGMTVRKIMVPAAAAASLTAETAAPLAAILSTASASAATVTDPVTGRSAMLTFASTTPKADAASATVYYLQRVPRAAGAAATGDAAKDAVANAAAAFADLPADQRMQAMRDLQRQMFESMTPEERAAMRQRGGPGRGGFGGGGPGGGGPDGGQGGPGGGGFGGQGGFGGGPGGPDGGPGGPGGGDGGFAPPPGQ